MKSVCNKKTNLKSSGAEVLVDTLDIDNDLELNNLKLKSTVPRRISKDLTPSADLSSDNDSLPPKKKQRIMNKGAW